MGGIGLAGGCITTTPTSPLTETKVGVEAEWYSMDPDPAILEQLEEQPAPDTPTPQIPANVTARQQSLEERQLPAEAWITELPRPEPEPSPELSNAADDSMKVGSAAPEPRRDPVVRQADASPQPEPHPTTVASNALDSPEPTEPATDQAKPTSDVCLIQLLGVAADASGRTAALVNLPGRGVQLIRTGDWISLQPDGGGDGGGEAAAQVVRITNTALVVRNENGNRTIPICK